MKEGLKESEKEENRVKREKKRGQKVEKEKGRKRGVIVKDEEE